MHGEHESVDRLRAALDELAGADAGELLAEARVQARERVRSMLAEALAESLLRRVEAQLGVASAPAVPAHAGTPPDPVSDETAQPPDPSEQVLYVYGVISADAASALKEGDEPAVQTVVEGPLAAVVDHVDGREFGEAQLREHLGDTDWVERVALNHERVLDEVRRRMTVIPMRMCTVYRSEAGVREMLGREASALQTALEHLSGKTEWGVKVFTNRARARSAVAARDDAADRAAPTAGEGAAYMQRRQRERDEDERLAQLIERAAGEIHESLRAVASDGIAVPLQRPEVSGRRGEMVLNGVYLVEDDEEDAFHERVRALEADFGPVGIELEETGPWPAYNFVPGTIGAAW